jgi:small subunit ribosomal protein S16
VGRNKQSNFRVVVTEKTAPRDGAYIEAIGFYNPRPKPAELRLDLAKLDEWIERGAELSDTVASLARKARRGGDSKIALKVGPQSTVQPSASESAPAPATEESPRAATAAEPAEESRGAATAAEPPAEASAPEPADASAPELAEASVAKPTDGSAPGEPADAPEKTVDG